MLNKVVNVAAGVVALSSILFVSLDSASATTLYEVNGSFTGSLLAQTVGGNSDVFSSTMNGSLRYEEAAKQAYLTFDFSGIVSDATNGPAVGAISGEISYFWNNVQEVTLNGNEFLLATTPDGQGNGAGAVASISITANGVTDDATFTLASKAFDPTEHNATNYANYNPVSDYLKNQGQAAYLIVGDLNGFQNAVKSWYMSSAFGLNLGAGRTGDYIIVSDMHGNGTPGGNTEVPEPASMALLGMGLLGGVFARKRSA